MPCAGKKQNLAPHEIPYAMVQEAVRRYDSGATGLAAVAEQMRAAGYEKINPMKVRKLLITGQFLGLQEYESKAADRVLELYAEGYGTKAIMKKLQISSASVYSYLPYKRVLYLEENREKCITADWVHVWRQQQAVRMLTLEKTEDNLWKAMKAFQGCPFQTVSGLPFTYRLRTGRNGGYTKELLIDRRENSKSLVWSSVLLAFEAAKERAGENVARPKALGDIRGISYIYPIFCRFGLITVPEHLAEKMGTQQKESLNECAEEHIANRN